jgi:hypothetical protein
VDVPAGPGDDDGVKLVRVYETRDPVRGLLVRGLLEAEGLDVLAKGEGAGPYRMGPVILFVPEEQAERAGELVTAAEDGSLALTPGDELEMESLEDLAMETPGTD